MTSPAGAPPAAASTERASAELRERLASLLRVAAQPLDVVITHIEVNDRHGVGVLTRRIFAGHPDVLSIRSQDHFGGDQQFGRVQLRLAHPGPRPETYRRVLDAVAGYALARVVCIPYYPDDAWTAVALKDTHGLPLCTYLMDDQNVHADGIPDALMFELLQKSELRLAISPDFAAAYERKYGLSFAVLPPVVDGDLILSAPSLPPASELPARRGVVVGNVWSQRWLELLRATVRGSGVDLDWYCNSGLRWHGVTPEDLAADGIRVRGAVSDAVLVAALRERAFAVIPSGTLDDGDDRSFIAQLSLPSRIPYILATSHAPMIVLGDERTGAARFVTRSGVGVVAPYDAPGFLRAVEDVTAPAAQERMRRRAAAMAPGFRSHGVLEWIWRSLEARGPVDDRFSTLVPRDP